MPSLSYMWIDYKQICDWVVWGVIGAGLAFPLLLLNIKLAPRLGTIDWPKARGVTDEQIPIIGSSLVLFSFGIFAALSFFYSLSPWFIITASIIGIMGFVDDRKPLSAVDKIFFQMACAIAVIFLEPSIYNAIVVKYGAAGAFWGIIFILGLVNAINFIDGIDGLAAVVITIGSLGYLFLCGKNYQQPGLRIYAALLTGMMLPFFYLNVRNRRGFLGNVGSYFFAYVLAMMHLSLPIDSIGPVPRLSISGLCFLIPIADAATVVSLRLLTYRSPFQADKGHLHHRLIQTSIPLKYILLTFGAIELSAVGVAYLLVEPGVSHSALPTLICLSHLIITSVLILLVERASRRRVQAYFQRLDTGMRIYFLKYEIRKQDGSPISLRTLRRLDAKVGAEIRITDLCVAEKPCYLYVTLRSPVEPVRGISSRLDTIFQNEKVQVKLDV